MQYRRTLMIAAVVAATATTLSMPGTALAAKAKGKTPAVRDTDRDGMPDKWERANGLDGRHRDSGGDRDRDGLSNLREFKAGTNARKADTDRDGLPDGWEVRYRLNPLRTDATGDPDADDLTNEQEYVVGTGPRTADSNRDGVDDGDEDPDGDGLTSVQEFSLDLDPTVADTDDNGVDDGDEDPDEDGLTDREEFELAADPRNPDSDGNGVRDGDEDTDGDGRTDEEELRDGTDPSESEDSDDEGEDSGPVVADYDATDGTLVLEDGDGMTIVVTVTEATALSWHRRSVSCPEPATVEDLTPGRQVHELELQDSDDDAPVADEISLVC